MITNYSPSRSLSLARSENKSLLRGQVPISKFFYEKERMSLALVLFFIMFFTQLSNAQTNYYSKAAATDFNNVNSWGTAADGSGASPASVSNADNFFVANSAALSLSANASVRQLTLASGSLTLETNTLTVSAATGNNSTLSINGGTLNVNSGTLVVNGNMALLAGGFNQSGGDIIIDPNSGVAGTSVASGTVTLNFSVAPGVVSGGTITIVDPNFNTGGKAVNFDTAGGNSVWSNNHTLRLGDGVSTDPSSNTAGFILESYTGTGKLVYGNLIINGGAAANRHVSLGGWSVFVNGDVTVNSGSEFRINSSSTSPVLSKNIINNGIITATVNVTFAATSGASTVTNTVSQTVSGSGVFRNLLTAPTANFNSVTINNTSSGGVTFLGTSNIAAQPANSFSVSGTLTFTAGKINMSGGASFILGSSISSLGTLSYTAGGFASGSMFGRWFGATTAGTAITANTDPTTVTTRYPFVNSNNAVRSAWLERVTPVAAGGILAVTYTNVDGISPGVLTDGAAILDMKANDRWAISSLGGTPTAAASFKLGIVAPTIFGGTLNNNTVRIVKSDNTFVGTHQGGTVTPGGQRAGILPADLMTGSFTLAAVAADIPYTSVANGDWNSPATWNKGTVPACGDPVFITSGTTVTVNSAGNIAKNLTINFGGALVQASGDLTIDACTSVNNNYLLNNGTLTVTGGILNVNGNLNIATGSAFNQSGGNINVDGNQGAVTANSVASGTHIVLINSDLGSLTGGILTVVDPHAASSTSSYAFSYAASVAKNNTAGWTLKFGNGISTDAGGTTGTASAAGGFIWNNAGGKIYYDAVIVDGGIGTNRNVYNSSTTIGINNLTINANSEFVMATSGVNIGGNLVNNGTFTHSAATLAFQNFQSAAASASANAQAISGTGIFRNNIAAGSVTANLASVTFNNNNATGITLNVPLTVSGTLTMTSGLINTTNTNILRLGTAAVAGTFAGTPSATNMVRGPFARTIASANAAYILFPVGKSSYAPIWLAPTTTAVSAMKAEAFDSNTGTADASIMGLNASLRWEAPIVSGTITDVKVRIGDDDLVTGNIPVQAPTGAGIYTAAFGSTATFAAGTPNTVQSSVAVPSANYTGFIGYATSNACTGTPAPGNTVASSLTICLGSSITLSLQNVTAGSGVTYVWESSADGTTFAPIAGATASTYVTAPTAALYYRASVTCGGNTGVSAPVQVTFTNNILTTAPATRCGNGTVSLAATATAGTVINWYAQAAGGIPVATGSSFVTPSISATTSYWADAQTSGSTLAGGIIAPPSSWSGSTFLDWGIIFNTLTAVTVNSVDLYSTAAGTVNLKIVNAAGTELYSTGNVNIANGGVTTPNVVPINFYLPVGENYKILVKSYTGVNLVRGSTSLAFPYTNGHISVTASENGGTTTASYYYMHNIKTTVYCTSPRVEVVATVTAPPALTLSGNPAAICSGQSSTPVTVTSGASDFDTYVWSPSTGVSGDAATGWIFNPAVTTSYTLTASQSTGSLCNTTASVVVSVNALPIPVIISPSPASVCENTILPLFVTGGTIGIAGKIGSGTATNGLSTPFKANWGGSKTQALYTAAELTALGIQPGQKVNSIGFVSLSGTPSAFNNFTISAGFVSAPVLGAAFIPGANTVVYAPATYTPATGTGNLDFSLATPLVWDGVSNLLVETCFNNNTSGSGSAAVLSVQSSTVASGLNLYRSQDLTADVCSNATAPSTTSNRPNLRISTLETTSFTWSPAANLYSDAAATTPYVAGTNASTVYFKSSTAAPAATYTATATSVASCSVSASVNVTVNAIVAPDFAAIPAFCSGTAAPALATTSPNGITGTWSPATVSNTASGTYVFTPTAGQCATPQTLAVTVTPSIVPDFAAIPAFCSGATAPTLAAASPNGITGTWSPATVSNTASGTYVFTPSAGQCATTQTLSVTVTVTAAPTGTSPQDYTTGNTVADFVVAGTGIIWYDAPTGGNVLPSTTVLVSGVTYYSSQTVSGCESPTRLPITAGNNLKVDGFGFKSLKYYPNPVNNVLTVSYSEEITGLKLYNMVGQELMNKKVSATETQLDMSHLPAGSYLLEVSSGAQSKMVKLLKNQ